jgi:hypothetical protein
MVQQTHNNVIPQTFPNRMRIPPQNLEAEMAFLGSVMLRPEALFDVEAPQTNEKLSVMFQRLN